MTRPFLLIQIRHVHCGGLFRTTIRGTDAVDVFVCSTCATEIEVQLVQSRPMQPPALIRNQRNALP